VPQLVAHTADAGDTEVNHQLADRPVANALDFGQLVSLSPLHAAATPPGYAAAVGILALAPAKHVF
jgi:hypothetical protein